MQTLEYVVDANSLAEAYRKAKKGSFWKTSVQNFGANLFKNIYKLQANILDGSYKQDQFFEFTINERGKTRYIKAMSVRDRVLQRSFCDNVLTPALKPYLIYDNGASVTGKGITFAHKRLKIHLQRHIRKYGLEGYILLIDFKKYFDNIPHEKLLEHIKPHIQDERCFNLLKLMLDSFKIDVSYMTDEEYNKALTVPFNALEYSRNIKSHQKTGKRFLYRSVGIGSQVSQDLGIFYPTQIDNLCKIVYRCKNYARYMDDIYIIHHDKEFLKHILEEVKKMAEKIGIFINNNKTFIIPLKHGFTFLKVKYRFTDTHKIICIPSRETFARERRRLKKFYHLMQTGAMNKGDIVNAYKGWRGGLKRLASYRSLKNVDTLFLKLFNTSYGG